MKYNIRSVRGRTVLKKWKEDENRKGKRYKKVTECKFESVYRGRRQTNKQKKAH